MRQDTNKPMVFAKEVMQDKHIEMDGLLTVENALVQMKENRASAVIIKKRHEHDEYGIVLLSDIAKKVLAKDKSPERVNLYEIMSKPVVSISPDMDVRYCARLFENFGLSYAPVIKDNTVLGLVSYEDLVFKGLLVESSS